MSKDYFPLVADSRLYYVFVDYSNPEPAFHHMVWEVESVSRTARGLAAQTARRWDGRPAEAIEIVRDGQGTWIGKNLELPHSLKAGARWEVQDDPNDIPLRSVGSLKAKASTLKKEFSGCLEIGFTNEVEGGSRFYAPGVGLVREEWSGESIASLLILAAWHIPKPAAKNRP